jgi:hypothetical protein
MHRVAKATPTPHRTRSSPTVRPRSYIRHWYFVESDNVIGQTKNGRGEFERPVGSAQPVVRVIPDWTRSKRETPGATKRRVDAAALLNSMPTCPEVV